jgi:hypothetical protein
MKNKMKTLALLGFSALLLAIPASAGTAYSNGPINGTVDGWTINSGYDVADTFSLSSAQTLTSVTFGAWTTPGDTVNDVSWAIVLDPTTCTPTCAAPLFSGTAAVTQTFLEAGTGFAAGLNIDSESFNLPASVTLGPGNFWLVLQGATDTAANTDLIYWDENDGPSEAYTGGGGGGNQGFITPSNPNFWTTPGDPASTICTSPGTTGYCSESFTINNSLPEPSSLALGGFGLVLLGALRRKLKK